MINCKNEEKRWNFASKVNQDWIPPNEKLSDEIYYYDRKDSIETLY